MVDLGMKTRAVREDVVDKFFHGTGRSYDRVVDITTYGLDRHWKRQLLKLIPRGAGRILDLACGTGIVTKRIHKLHPEAQIVGVDITEEYLAVAREKFAEIEADVTFIHSNAEEMELEGQFDAVVSCYIPKYVDPDILLERLEGHVAPGGIVALHDFDYPRGWLSRGIWNTHMWLLKHVGRRMFPQWKVVFEENLAELIRESKWTRRYKQAFERHGYTRIRHDRLSWRSASIISAMRPRD